MITSIMKVNDLKCLWQTVQLICVNSNINQCYQFNIKCNPADDAPKCLDAAN